MDVDISLQLGDLRIEVCNPLKHKGAQLAHRLRKGRRRLIERRRQTRDMGSPLRGDDAELRQMTA